ncbi:hypothetical protein BOX15_Mlig008173g1, partial [Macrostomum lignano]
KTSKSCSIFSCPKLFRGFYRAMIKRLIIKTSSHKCLLLIAAVILAIFANTSGAISRSCSRGSYFNSLSGMCDPCPTECLTSPQSPNVTDYMRRKCQKLADQCSPNLATSKSGSTSSTPTSDSPVSKSPKNSEAGVNNEDRQAPPDDRYGHKAAGGIVGAAILLLIFVPVGKKLRSIIIRNRRPGESNIPMQNIKENSDAASATLLSGSNNTQEPNGFQINEEATADDKVTSQPDNPPEDPPAVPNVE